MSKCTSPHLPIPLRLKIIILCVCCVCMFITFTTRWYPWLIKIIFCTYVPPRPHKNEGPLQVGVIFAVHILLTIGTRIVRKVMRVPKYNRCNLEFRVSNNPANNLRTQSSYPVLEKIPASVILRHTLFEIIFSRDLFSIRTPYCPVPTERA